LKTRTSDLETGRGARRQSTTISTTAAFVIACLLAAAGLAASAAPQEEKPKAVDSVLGVRVGSTLEEAQGKLREHGTGGGRATGDGGRKEAWTLKDTEFTSVAFRTNAKGRVVWVTGFVRPGREIPFAQLGDLARAARKDTLQAVWNVEKPEGSYRLVAKGPDGKARVVSLLQLEARTIQ
jgi:hypothetical protein